MPRAIVTRRRRQQRRGLSMILVVIILVVLIAFVSFAVDVGRVRLALAELQTVADAAARNGAYALPKSDGTHTPIRSTQYVIDETMDAAVRNPVIDNDDTHNNRTDPGMQLDAAEDIHFGVWDNVHRTFTEIIDQPDTAGDERRLANAVQVWGRRLEERNNPVKLVFAPVVGAFSKNVEQHATAYVEGESSVSYGFVGLDSVYSNGNGATLNGGVISDGNIDLGNADVNGDARPGIGKDITQEDNSVVTGWMADLDFSIKGLNLYPVINAAPLGLPQIPNNGVLIGGTGPVTRISYHGSLPKSSKITVNGYVRLYIEDAPKGILDLKFLEVTWVNPSTPNSNRLEFYVVGSKVKEVSTEGNRPFWCHIYAPQCDVHLRGTNDFYGWAIGKTIEWRGTATYNYDGTLTPQPVHTVKVHLVQ